MNVVLRTEGYHPAIKEELFLLENFEYIINFMKRANMPFVALIGKDPIKHPQYFEFIELCMKHEVYVRTLINDVSDNDMLDHLAQIAAANNDSVDDKVGFLINMTEYSSDNHSLAYAVKTIGQWSATSVTLGYNSVDLGILYDVVVDHNLIPIIKIGMSLPIPNNPYKPVALEDYDKIIAQITKDTDFRRKHNISLVMDCGFPVCKFTKEMIGDLYTSPMTNLDFICAPKIEILPNLEVVHCSALAGECAVNIKDFKEFSELTNYLRVYFKEYQPMYGKCYDCWFKNSLCGGGCKGFNLIKNKEE